MDVIIKKLTIEYNTPASQPVDNYIQQAEDFVKNKLVPLLERLFENAYQVQRSLYLPKMELDLDFSKSVNGLPGLLALSDIQLMEVLQEQVASQVKEKAIATNENFAAWGHFFFIVDNGYKHWAYLYSSQAHFESTLIETLPALFSNDNLRTELADKLNNANMLLRIRNVVSSIFLKKLFISIVDFYLPEDKFFKGNMEKFWEKADPWNNTVEAKEVIKFSSWLLTTVNPTAEANAAQVSFNKKYKKQQNQPSLWNNLSSLILKQENTGKGKRKGKLKVEDTLQQHAANPIVTFTNGQQNSPELVFLKEEHKPGKRPPETKSPHDEGLDERVSTGRKKLFTDKRLSVGDDSGEGVFCSNAGLVIMAPYLPALFARLKMLEGDTIKKISQAVYMVQYLAGSEDYFEQELLMAKVLCGVDFETVLEPRKTFTKKALTEMKDLLASLNTHWPAIKNTSPQTIQQMFLQRPGKLIIEGSQATLLVEKKSEDVLLGYIPWTFKMLQLPWMSVLVKVEW